MPLKVFETRSLLRFFIGWEKSLNCQVKFWFLLTHLEAKIVIINALAYFPIRICLIVEHFPINNSSEKLMYNRA